MTRMNFGFVTFGAAMLLAAVPTLAQTPAPGAQQAAPTAPAMAPAQQTAAAPGMPMDMDTVSVYFDSGSAAVRPDDAAKLDQAARMYRSGQGLVMILTSTTDPTGSAAGNLQLSQLRASAVVRGLLARGIPADRFQILAKGQSDLPIPAKAGQAEPRDRLVQIDCRMPEASMSKMSETSTLKMPEASMAKMPEADTAGTSKGAMQ